MKKKNRSAKIFSLILIILSAIVLFSFLGIYFYAETNIDYSLDEKLLSCARGESATRFFYDTSFGYGEYRPRELNTSFGSKSENWYEYNEIGDNLKSAFIAVEDRSFFKHHGVNFKRTLYAAFNHLFHVKSKFGASTITQQLIKNLSGDNEQTIGRKFSELLRATHLENAHTKEEIFEAYLNVIPMGNGIVGVGSASREYFGKKPDSLTAAEAATLVGITNAPARYNPITNPQSCKEKRNSVLKTMLECGVIEAFEYENASKSELAVLEPLDEKSDVNSWLVETICDDISQDLAKSKKISKSAARSLLMNGGFSVYTTVNPEVQSTLEHYFENVNNFPEAVSSGLQYSMVVLDSSNGNLLGIVGAVGKKSGNLLLNHALMPITPGSSLKPLALYAPALDKKLVNWATVFDDVPLEFKKTKEGEYQEYPKNYPQVYDGLITLSDALRLSKNTVAVRLYNLLGKESIFKSLKNDFGFDLVDSQTLSNGGKLTDKASSPLALGQLSYGVSLRELTGAYTVFPRYGEYSKPRSYLAVFDDNGNLVLENTSEAKRVFATDTTQIMNQLLMRVTESGTAKQVTLDTVVDTAGKTGTSGNDKDRIFIGYTPYCTAGIWCGYPNKSKSIGAQSVSHLEIWDDVMREIHELLLGKEDAVRSFSVKDVKRFPYCKDSGHLYSVNCMYDPRGVRLEYGYFTADNKPSGDCQRHVLCMYDELTDAIATDRCPKEYLKLIALLDISERSFPKEIYVTDAEYVYRSLEKGSRLGDSYDVPYFIYTIDDGEFVGKSKSKKQYNSSCYLHSD